MPRTITHVGGGMEFKQEIPDPTMSPFIDQDESMILMDIPTVTGQLLDDEDLKKLHDAGIRTAQMFYHDWNVIEPTPGAYNWDPIDRYLERLQRNGFKALIMTPTWGCAWFPDSWCAMTAHGKALDERGFGVLSPWNDAAQAHLIGYYQALAARYNKPGQSMVINAQQTSGETFFLNEPAYYDTCALGSYQEYTGNAGIPTPKDPDTEQWLFESLLNMLLGQNKVLCESSGEVWMMQHPAIADFNLYGNGNQWIGQFLTAYRATFPEAQINQIYYTWVQWAGYWARMNFWRDTFKTNVWGGAEYCEGLVSSVPAAIANGLRGLLIGPCHPFTGHEHIEPWMVTAIKVAYKRLQNRPA